MKQRAAGLVLWLLLLCLVLPGMVLVPLLVLFGPIKWARKALTALDLFGNASVLAGNPYETISSHTGRELAYGTWWAVAINAVLDVLQPGHCTGAAKQEAPQLAALAPFIGD
jgi:hypothetical protein